MAAEQMFDFDTSKEVGQVANFEKALDSLFGKLGELNNANLTKLKQTVAESSNVSSNSAKDLVAQVAKMKNSLEGLLALQEKLAGGDQSKATAGALNKLVTTTTREGKQLLQIVRTSLAAMEKMRQDSLDREMEMVHQFYRNQSSTAYNAAKASNAAFSDIAKSGYAGATKNFNEFVVGMKASSEQLAAVYAKLGLLVKEGGLGSIRTSLATDSAVILGEMSAFYSKMEADVARFAMIQAKLGALAKDSGLSSIRKALKTDSALILSEMNAFYSKMESDATRMAAIWGRMGNLAKDNSGLRSIRTALATDSAMINAEMKGYYTALEKASDLKAQIKARLGTANVGGGISAGSVLRPTFDQKDAVYAQGMKDLKDHYTALETTVAKGGVKQWMKGFTTDSKELVAAARGMTGAFGQLGTSFSTLLPYLAGAAIGQGVKSVVTMGAQVNNTMETIRNLSQESTSSMEGLNAQLLTLARSGPFGPQEVANAMKTLSLAGLDAEKVGKSIKDVLNFAVAGDTSIEKAADVMTTVATAFNISAEGFNYVGDVIAKTAAVSKSSIESIGEAFKTSSVLYKQYGVQLEDVGTGLAALSNLGIQGTAAGVALRNMYVDLAGRTPKVTKALKEVGLVLTDNNGDFLDLITMTQRVNDAMDKMDNNMQKKQWLRDVLSERGGKPMIELVDLARRQAVELGTTADSMLAEMRNKILQSAGFMIGAAAEMAMTPLNQMKSVAATLQATVVETFDGLAPVILDVSMKLKNIFNSDEFKNGLANVMTMVANLTVTFVEHLDVIARMAEAYLAFKVLTVVNGLFTGLAATLTAVGASSALAGTGMAALATRIVGFLPLMGGVAAVVAAGTAAWYLYNLTTEKSIRNKDEKAAENYSKSLVEQLNAESARLAENTKALQLNMDVAELRRLKEQQAKKDESRKLEQSAVNAAENDAAAATEKLNKMQGTFGNTEYAKSAAGARALKDAKDAADAANQNVLTARRNSAFRQAEEAEAEGKVKTESMLLESALKAKQQKDKLDASQYASGEAGYAPKGRPAFVPKTPPVAADADNALALAKTAYEKDLALARTMGDNKLKVLDSFRNANAISEGTYQAGALRAIANSEQDQLLQIDSSFEKMLDLTSEKMVKQQELIDKAAPGSENQKKLQQDLENTEQAWDALQAQFANDRSKIADAALTRLQITAAKTEGAIRTLEKASVDYWNAADKATARQAKGDGIEKQYRNMNQSILSFDVARRAAAEAALAEEEKHANYLENLQTKSRELNDTRLDYITAATANENVLDEIDKGYIDSLDKQIEKTQELLSLGGNRASAAAANAANRAFNRAREQQLDSINNDITDAMMTAIFEGGQAGGEKFIAFLKRELLMNPMQVILKGAISELTGGLLGGNAAGGGGGGILGTASNLQSAYNMGSKAYGWLGLGGGAAASGAGGLGLLAAGSTATVTTAAGAITGAGTAVGGGLSTGLIGSSGLGLTGGSTLGAGIGSTLGGSAVGGAAVGGSAAGGVGAGISGALAAVPVWGWVALAAIAAFKIFGGKGGGPKVDGDYHTNEYYNDGGTIYGTSTGKINGGGAYDSQAKATFDGLTSNYSSLALALGGQVGKVTGDMKISRDPQGDAKTILQMITTLNGQQVYNRGQEYGTVENVGREDADLEEAVNLASAKSLLNLAKATEGIEPSVKAFLNTLDATKMSVDQINEALTRATAFVAFKKAIAELPFENLKKLTMIGAESLVALTGGMDAFVSKLEAYRTAFYSDAERTLATTQAVSKALGLLGYEMPKTRDGFRDLMDAQDVTTDSGRATYVALLNLSAAFAELTPMAKSFEDIVKASSELRNSALDSLSMAIDAEKVKLEAAQNTAQEVLDTMTSLFDYLDGQVRDLYKSVKSTAAGNSKAGQAFIQNALTNALATGYLPDQDELTKAVEDVRAGLDDNAFASQFEADQARLILAGQLDQLEKLAGTQKNGAQLTVDALAAQATALDATLEYWKMQIGIANGTYAATMSVSAAVANLTAVMAQNAQNTAAALAAQQAAAAAAQQAATVAPVTVIPKAPAVVDPVVAAPTPAPTPAYQTDAAFLQWKATMSAPQQRDNGMPIQSLAWRQLFGRMSAQELYQYWEANAKNAVDYGYGEGNGSGGDGYAVGTNYVPHDMVTKIHKGEAVVPRIYNPAAGGSGYQAGGGGRTEALLDALVNAVVVLQQQNQDLIKQNLRSANALNGNPEQPMLVETVN